MSRQLRRIIPFSKKYGITALIVSSALAVFTFISVIKHLYFQSNAFDLAIFTQTSWLISHFQEPYSTIRMIFQPADHFAPTYWLLSLPYALFNSPIYLLLLQIGSVIAGGIPVWRIAKDSLKSSVAADFLLIAYFFQIGVISAVAFDFSTSALSIGFSAWAIYFWYRGQFRPYLVFLILALGCKEDMPILFGAFSLLMLYRRQWKWFLTTLIICLVWFFGVIYVIMPLVFKHHNEYLGHGNPLTGWAIKESAIRQIFRQNLGFALLNPIGVLFGGANLAIRFLKPTANYWQNDFHYGANIAAPLIISTALGIKTFIARTRIDQRTAAVLISLAIAAATVVTMGSVSGIVRPLPVSRQSIDTVLAEIPDNATLSAQSALAPHLTNRTEIYLFPNISRRCGPQCGTVEYIVLSKNVNAWPLTAEDLDAKIGQLLQDPTYTVVSQNQGTYLFKRN